MLIKIILQCLALRTLQSVKGVLGKGRKEETVTSNHY